MLPIPSIDPRLPDRPSLWDNLSTPRPKVINFQVNDICNARCVMCGIWKQDVSPELSPEEFGDLLGDPFLSEVEQVGITGGEPTLRKDLAEFYFMALDRLPLLKGGHFITNGFSATRAVETYGQAARAFHEAGIYFGGMVSIDGVGEVHDRVRGRRGAFDRATKTLEILRARDIPTTACCTIVRDNVYGLADLLDWGMRKGVYVRFRVAEFIQRLYNEDARDHIRAFAPPEIKHLVAFFHILLVWYEKDIAVRRTYQSILSLLTGGHRITACPYQSTVSIVLDSQGRFSQCSPQGLPAEVRGSMEAVAQEQLSHRAWVLRDACKSCIHDYHGPWLPAVEARAKANSAAADALYAATAQSSVRERAAEPFDPTAHARIMIVGWYGTETAGDIAILGGVLSEYLRLNPALRFTLLSLYPDYTRTTLRDLPSVVTEAIDLCAYRSEVAARHVDLDGAIVMAGGPLMDIAETGFIATLFEAFAERGKPCVLECVGAGPLRDPVFADNVRRSGWAATAIRVRDHGSRFEFRRLGVMKQIGVRSDPAVGYIADHAGPWRGGSGTIRCYLRSITSEYLHDVTADESRRSLECLLCNLLVWYPSFKIELLAMHYFPIGGDDRVFARDLEQAIGDPRLTHIVVPMSPLEIAQSMADAEFCITMRFHSSVFARTIGAPFMAIDYTSGGKIDAFLREQSLTGAVVSLDELARVTPMRLQEALAVTGLGTKVAA